MLLCIASGHSIFRFILECSYWVLFMCSCVALPWLSFFFVSDCLRTFMLCWYHPSSVPSHVHFMLGLRMSNDIPLVSLLFKRWSTQMLTTFSFLSSTDGNLGVPWSTTTSTITRHFRSHWNSSCQNCQNSTHQNYHVHTAVTHMMQPSKSCKKERSGRCMDIAYWK